MACGTTWFAAEMPRLDEGACGSIAGIELMNGARFVHDQLQMLDGEVAVAQRARPWRR